MPYPAQENYIQFLSQLLDEFEQTQTQSPIGPGRPFVHKNRALIGFFALMVIKGCTAFRAMRRYLEHQPEEALKFGISQIPSRWTLARRLASPLRGDSAIRRLCRSMGRSAGGIVPS